MVARVFSIAITLVIVRSFVTRQETPATAQTRSEEVRIHEVEVMLHWAREAPGSLIRPKHLK